jgi:hypothetical protein
LPSFLVPDDPRFGRRILPVFDIQLPGEPKCIEIERLARFDGVSSGELGESGPT